MRMTRRVRLALAAAFSLLTLVLCLAYGQQVRADADRERAEALERYGGEVTKVVVAGQALEVGDVVSRQNVVERDWVSDLVPKGSYVSLTRSSDARSRSRQARALPSRSSTSGRRQPLRMFRTATLPHPFRLARSSACLRTLGSAQESWPSGSGSPGRGS